MKIHSVCARQCSATAEHTSCSKLKLDAGGELYSKSNKIETLNSKYSNINQYIILDKFKEIRERQKIRIRKTANTTMTKLRK